MPMNKDACSSKLAVHVPLGVYFGTINGMYTVRVLSMKGILRSKHMVFGEEKFPISSL